MSNLTSDIALPLGDDDCALRPSLKAGIAISRQFGGLNKAFAELSAGNLDAYIFIIRQGLPKEDARRFSGDDLGEAVWRTGMDNLAEPVARFVNVLRHGGRDPDIAADDDDEGASGNDSLHV